MQDRWLFRRLGSLKDRPFVHIVFGARQTGKTTLLRELLPDASLRLNLADPEERTRYLADPGLLGRECRALQPRAEPHEVFIDEAQAVPSVFDTVQVLFDEDRTRWRFFLCGSSARRLRKAGTNLLPGRSLLHRLYPLVLQERPALPGLDGTAPELLPLQVPGELEPRFPAAGLEERLAYGELPGVVLLDEEDRKMVLRSYAVAHLEEEIRREALVRDWGAFVNFLRLAASESGGILNYTSLSREVGVSVPTIKGYYQLLEDMFLGFRVQGFSGSPRKSLLSTPRFVMFDLGVRHAAAGLIPDVNIVRADPGRYFEQWVGIELWKRLSYRGDGQLTYFRTKDGAEVDYIVERGEEVIPIEVKWSRHPTLKDVPGLAAFLRDHPRARRGYVVCRSPRTAELSKTVTAIPWHAL